MIRRPVSVEAERLMRAAGLIEELVAFREHGPTDRRVRVRAIDLAVANCAAWCAVSVPGTSGDASRGGSSSPTEESERAEAAKVSRRAGIDTVRFSSLTKRVERDLRRLLTIRSELTDRIRQIERDCRDLERMLAPYTETVDHSRLPSSDAVPGCVSCARLQPGTGTGHFAPAAPPDPHGVKRWGAALAESVASLGLCRFCRFHAVENARQVGDVEVGVRHFVALEAVDRLHRDGEQAAGRWLAKQEGTR